jgi:hypothetical protein
MDETTTIILFGLAVVVLLAGVYLVTRPAPESDVSWDQIVDLGAKVASYYYGAGA